MSLLAVIPCLNEAAHLPKLLAQMLDEPGIDLLAIADGGSTDGSREIVRRWSETDPRIRLLDNPQRLQSAGVNLAVATFGNGFDWLLRIDAHCLYPEGYVATLLAAATAQECDAVVVPMITRGRDGFQLAAAAAQNSVLGTGGSAHRHVGEGGKFVEHGHHALMSLPLFRKIGGYCESMPCNEDAEFDHRFGLVGGKIWLEPAAAIVYFPRSSPMALARQYFRYGSGRARNLLRHRMKPRLRQLFPLAVPVALAVLPLATIDPLWAVPAAGWLALCLALGGIAGLRQGGGWALLAGAAAAIMHLAWALGFLRELAENPCGSRGRYRAEELAGDAAPAPGQPQRSSAGLFRE